MAIPSKWTGVVHMKIYDRGTFRQKTFFDPRHEQLMGCCADRVTYEVTGEISPECREVLSGYD